MKSNIVLQMDVKDFEALSNTYMALDTTWNKQFRDGRFEGINVVMGTVLYWFDNPVSFILAKSYLKAIDEHFYPSYDNVTEQYVIMTRYEVRKDLTNAV